MSRLLNLRRWVRAALFLGVVVSIVANVLHARHNIISQSISAWAPLALLVTIELIARIPVHRRRLSVPRLLATAVIAGIAAWVSYWHMVGVALRYGEESGAAHMIPLSVDGLIVVASICLVELGGRIRAAEAGEEAVLADVSEPITDELDDEPISDPWVYSTPAAPQPTADRAVDVKPAVSRKPRKQAPPRARATRVAKRNPELTAVEIAAKAKVSDATARRAKAEVTGSEHLNGRVPDLEDAPV